MIVDPPYHSATSWFDPLYAAAGRDPSGVPWAHLEPCAWVTDFLARRPGGGKAAVVGCGLGDDAEAVAGAGYATVAFDVSRHAVAWCRERFPDSLVDYRVADLFDLPEDLIGAFDRVVEVRTIQSLPPSMRHDAIDAVASLIAPGGVAVIVALSRPDRTIPSGPPWAVSAEELRRLDEGDVRVASDYSESGHFVVEVSRSLGHE